MPVFPMACRHQQQVESTLRPSLDIAFQHANVPIGWTTMGRTFWARKFWQHSYASRSWLEEKISQLSTKGFCRPSAGQVQPRRSPARCLTKGQVTPIFDAKVHCEEHDCDVPPGASRSRGIPRSALPVRPAFLAVPLRGSVPETRPFRPTFPLSGT